MKNKYFAVASLLLITLSMSAFAQQAETSRDDIIKADVNKVLQNHVFYTIYDYILYGVKDGVVTLKGYATQPYKKESYEKSILKRVEGVKSVENDIEILPVSTVDDQIRYGIAMRIYNDDRLLRYAIASFPKPIHIIVSNGRVTLEGIVENQVDKRLAEANARGLTGVLSVTNNLQVRDDT